MEHPDTATCLDSLAINLYSQTRYADAEVLARRALAIREKVLSPEHPHTAGSLNNLAMLLESQGRYADAETLFLRSLAIREEVQGPEHPLTASALDNLACLLKAQGRYADAEPLLRRALAIKEKVLGPEHPDTAGSLNNLAFVLNFQRRHVHVEPLYYRAHAICEKVLGSEHPDTTLILVNLAKFNVEHGCQEAAWQLLSRAFSGGQGHLQQLFGKATEADRFRYVEQKRETLEYLLTLAGDPQATLSDACYQEEAYTALLSWKGQIFRSTAWIREKLFATLTDTQVG